MSSNDDESKRDLKQLLADAHDQGALSARSLAALDVVDVGAQIQAGLGVTIDDLLGEIATHDPALANKVYLVTDCMSAVTVPDGKGGFAADFTAQAEAALQKFADAGMHLVTSTTPISSWPGLRL